MRDCYSGLIFLPESENSIEAYMGFGANYSWFQYSSELKSLLPKGTFFYDVFSDWGYYAKVGACYYLVGPVFADAQLEYALINGKVNATGVVFDGGCLKATVHIGVAL